MTSTSFNVGLNDGTRLSSRVLRPPGGGHTDIFGGEPEAPRGRRPAPAAAANMHAQSANSIQPSNGTEAAAPVQNGQPSPVTPEQPAAVAAPAPTAPEQAAPAPAAPVAAAPETKQSSTNIPDAPKRVRVPPGGFSSGLW